MMPLGWLLADHGTHHLSLSAERGTALKTRAGRQ
jgi:hypothetical protein